MDGYALYILVFSAGAIVGHFATIIREHRRLKGARKLGIDLNEWMDAA